MKKFSIFTFLFCLVLNIQACTKLEEIEETIDVLTNQDVVKFSMPVTFGDGMVLQRDMPVRIFG